MLLEPWRLAQLGASPSTPGTEMLRRRDDNWTVPGTIAQRIRTGFVHRSLVGRLPDHTPVPCGHAFG